MSKETGSIQINAALTQKIANLSRIQLTEQEVENFTQQLSKILGYIDLLNEVDFQAAEKAMGAKVEPMVQAVSHSLPLREDVESPFPTLPDGRPGILESPSGILMDGFQVPQIL